MYGRLANASMSMSLLFECMCTDGCNVLTHGWVASAVCCSLISSISSTLPEIVSESKSFSYRSSRMELQLIVAQIIYQWYRPSMTCISAPLHTSFCHFLPSGSPCHTTGVAWLTRRWGGSHNITLLQKGSLPKNPPSVSHIHIIVIEG